MSQMMMTPTIELAMTSSIINIENEQGIFYAAEQAAAVLAGGGFLVAPTETRYGLIARADDQSLLEKMYRLKERETDKPVAMFLASVSDISLMGITNQLSDSIADNFLPGPLTLVLKTEHDWPPPLIVNGKIGLRISSEPFISALLERCNFPLCATSANKSDRNELDNVKEIADIFGSEIDLYIDKGSLTGLASTVIDCSLSKPVILREGSISKERIIKVWEKLS